MQEVFNNNELIIDQTNNSNFLKFYNVPNTSSRKSTLEGGKTDAKLNLKLLVPL